VLKINFKCALDDSKDHLNVKMGKLCAIIQYWPIYGYIQYNIN